MKQFALGFLVAACLFGGLVATAEEEKPTDKELMAYSAAEKRTWADFLSARNPLAVLESHGIHRDAVRTLRSQHRYRRTGQEPKPAGGLASPLISVRQWRDKLMASQTETAAKYCLSELRAAEEELRTTKNGK